MRSLPWDEPPTAVPRQWTDADDVRCAEWLQRREINVAPVTVSRSVAAVARDIRFHPVRDYLATACAGTACRASNPGPSPISGRRTRSCIGRSARCG